MLVPVICTLIVFAGFFVAISAGGAAALAGAATWLSQPPKAEAKPSTEAAKS